VYGRLHLAAWRAWTRSPRRATLTAADVPVPFDADHLLVFPAFPSQTKTHISLRFRARISMDAASSTQGGTPPAVKVARTGRGNQAFSSKIARDSDTQSVESKEPPLLGCQAAGT
jgi:hypothetical protein